MTLAKEVFCPTHRHRKGGLYEVISEGTLHTETGEVLVIYRDEQNKWWARPAQMFNDGRFARLEER